MKILLVYLGRRGGLANYSFEVSRALSQSPKTEVAFLVSAQVENLSEWQTLPNSLQTVFTFDSRASLLFSLVNPFTWFRLYQKIKLENPDIIYCPGFHFWLPIIYLLFPKTPKVFTLHDPILHSGEKALAISLAQSWLLKRSARVIVLSEVFKNSIANSEFVPHGAFDFCKSNFELNATAFDPTILFMGRILPYKGVDILLRAFSKIKKECPRARLIIAGEGSLAYSGNLLNQSGVVLKNKWLAEADMCELLRQSHILVCPYLDGTQSGVIPTAARYGVPVVASRVGGLVEQVIDGQTGMLVNPGDPNELASACLSILLNDDLRSKMSLAARAWAEKELSWESVAEKLLLIFSRIFNH